MAGDQLFKIGSVTNKKGGVLSASRHNKRTLQSKHGADKHIDVARTPLNYSLTGDRTPEEISRYAKAKMMLAGIENPRKNGVMAVELIFSLPVDRHHKDTKLFFTDCYEWTLKTFACELLSFDVHLDESAPHAHALILPLIDGKMQGDKLKGDRANISRLQALFHDQVAKRYGLVLAYKARLTASDKQNIEQQVLIRLRGDSVFESCVWPCVRDAIHKDPLQFAILLGITAPVKAKHTKSFIDYKRSKGKGSFIR